MTMIRNRLFAPAGREYHPLIIIIIIYFYDLHLLATGQLTRWSTTVLSTKIQIKSLAAKFTKEI